MTGKDRLAETAGDGTRNRNCHEPVAHNGYVFAGLQERPIGHLDAVVHGIERAGKCLQTGDPGGAAVLGKLQIGANDETRSRVAGVMLKGKSLTPLQAAMIRAPWCLAVSLFPYRVIDGLERDME